MEIMLVLLTLALGLAVGYIIGMDKTGKNVAIIKAQEISLKEQEDERIKAEHFQALMNYDTNQAYNRGGR